VFRISKEFHFSASHQLHGLAEGHPCGRVHGHNYIARVTLSGEELGPEGFILDYNDLKPFGAWIDSTLDHRHLNERMPTQPSAENMARWMAEKLLDVLPLPAGVSVAVAISETPKTWAEWSP
jgi:6-pyruvoyltetrahydropterin/6-carboxytetrahydropterin synthase